MCKKAITITVAKGERATTIKRKKKERSKEN